MLTLGFSGTDLPMIYGAILATELAGRGLPHSLTVDSKACKVRTDWFETELNKASQTLVARWDEGACMLALQPGRIVKLVREDFDLDPEDLLLRLVNVPFSIGSAAELYPEWTDGSLGEIYEGPGFAELHWPHGWACFFRGAGHDRLVSRRWLDFGPWKLRRGPHDTTLVQFHTLGMDAATALAQARIGHERMGISDTGGFIQGRYVYAYDLKGLYYPEQRKLHITVYGRDVSQREMLDACAARLYQRLGPDQPLDNVVYVFMEQEHAIAHLHELWLRGLECRTIINGEEVDLMAKYYPQPAPIEWSRVL